MGIKTYTNHNRLTCALIYGYSIRNDELRLNSGTFNGHEMPEQLERQLPYIFEKTLSGQTVELVVEAQQLEGHSHVVQRESPEGNHIAYIPNGTFVRVLEEYGNSVKVLPDDGYEGWVRKRNLKF